MKTHTKYIALIFMTLLYAACQNEPDTETVDIKEDEATSLYDGLEFDMPEVKEASFPDNGMLITDFKAIGDGLFMNTEAINKTINEVAEKGGGKVVIPRGVWLTGPITLKSNINLHLEEGALLIFSDDKSLYPLVETSFEGLNTYRTQSPISGKNLENIAITGSGIIDGNGDAWRPVKKSKMTSSQWKSLVKSGGVLSEDEKTWYPSESYKKANALTENFNVPPFKTRQEFEEVKEFLRPVMVSLVECKKVLLDGPTFQNSPAWNIHPLMCEDVIIRNLTVRNPWYSQNGDGLDLESCKNALIYNNNFDVGDDAICIKSGKDKDGRDRGVPTENVIVKNNIVYHGHGGFVVGSEMSGGVKNVHVSRCTFIGTDVGLRFKSTRGRGGVVENIYISDIDMINIPTDAIRFNLFYGGQSPILEEDQEAPEIDEEAVAVTEETPSFRNIYMKNINVTGSETAAFMQGLPEMKLKNINLENANFQSENGITLIDADGISFKNVKVAHNKGSAMTVYNGTDLKLDNVTLKESEKASLRVFGQSKGIVVNNSNFGEENTSSSKEVPAEAVKYQ
ncbi:glycoside hydrolase [Marivirga lumbricoides]|uniref:Glycoside hydrolase n=1 Tax=Marivirga lumbricoides TaxID=1046115 RepID=A0ABQ1LEV6_9BACT|nr:glycoside hydrolase [Marivirga lumbricoides]